MSFLTQNWVAILAGVGSIVTGASIIAKLTPSTHDDVVIARILKFIQWLSINGTGK